MTKKIKDYDAEKLRVEGEAEIRYAADRMPVLNNLVKQKALNEHKTLKGVKISLSIHLEAKTAYLCEVLHDLGADLCVAGSNSLTTRDSIVEALKAKGIKVFAKHGCTDEEYNLYIAQCLEHKPNIIVDDGADLVAAIHKMGICEDTWGGCEETTTGINRIQAMSEAGELKFPVIAVNDARCKHLFDNRYGTGQSVWDAIMRTTRMTIAGKIVVVAGFGLCGKGVAMSQRSWS